MWSGEEAGFGFRDYLGGLREYSQREGKGEEREDAGCGGLITTDRREMEKSIIMETEHMEVTGMTKYGVRVQRARIGTGWSTERDTR